ncbi:MAG: hypothetical protein J5760_06185 [Clostridia bacterium]|nr:hypothetical protein [Clostridia bacterium]
MKKILCLILAAILMLSVFVACKSEDGKEESRPAASGSPEASNTETVSESGESNVEEVSEEVSQSYEYGTNIPVKDLQGRVIRVLSMNWAANSSSMTYNGDIIQRDDYDEHTADVLDRTKYEVRKEIERRYNCTIEGVFDSNNFANVIYNQVQAPTENSYDIVLNSFGGAASATLTGVYVDMNAIPTIDLSNPWWDQNAVHDLSIGNKVYFTAGDINTFDNDGTFIVFYNKKVLADNCPGVNLYELVRNNEWTLDKMYELAKIVTHESSGDGTLDEEDTWGLGTEVYNVLLHLIASGVHLAEKDADDIPELSYNNERFYSVLSDVYNIYADESHVMVANAGKFDSKYTNVWEGTIIRAFREERELFYMGGMFNIVKFRDVENIGYLPVPKYNSDQDRYYHFVSTGNASCMAIPAVSDNYDDLGLIIEALGAESKNQVTPVYYEKCLKGKDADTVDDEDMLDIIFESRCFDLGAIYNWGGIYSQIANINPDGIRSRFEAIEGSVEEAMLTDIDTILMLDY